MPHSPEGSVHKGAAPKLRVALVGDRVDWHARQLGKAFTELGVGAEPVRLEDFRFVPDARCGLCVPGFDGGLPDAVFVRSMSGGSFEAVTLRLGFLHALRDLGVMVCNDARALANDLPSITSRDYGEPFAQIFKRFKGDFYAIDPMLFSPAEVTVTAIESGKSFHNGRIDLTLLDASFA